MVKTALESANKSRLVWTTLFFYPDIRTEWLSMQLARRLFYSFAKPDAEYLVVEDIVRFFSTPEDADAVFAILDKDSNGDASRDEVEMACL